jgi:CMP-N-acetylneuraminic acid synthetase
MKVLAVIPARGGSKGIPKKNITLLAGKPLIEYTINAAKAAEGIDRIVISTDCHEIKSVCESLGVEVLLRPAVLSTDFSATKDVLVHAVESLAARGYIFDAVMTLQPTSPLRSANHINEALQLFEGDPQADSLVSCVNVPHIYHPHSVMKVNDKGYLEPFINAEQPTRRQDKQPIFARNGAAIYITRTNRLIDYIYGGRLIPYMMDDYFSVDIDDQYDLLDAEKKLQQLFRFNR